MNIIGNENKTFTTDTMFVRVRYNCLFIGRGIIEELGLKENEFVEFNADDNGRIFLKKGNPNTGYKLFRRKHQLGINCVRLSRGINKIVNSNDSDMFKPFTILTTHKQVDVDGNEYVELYGWQKFKTREDRI